MFAISTLKGERVGPATKKETTNPMENIKYVVCKEDKYYVSQCLNVDVSSFGETVEEAIPSLKEAVSLYFENETEIAEYRVIGENLLGEDVVCA